MTEPMVSIVMPVYNAEKYLAEAIDSVLKQTYTKWELIIVNDGSTDNSQEVVQQYSDPRIHYFSQNRKGVSAARNHALQKIKGDFLCFLDADDSLTSNSIRSRLSLFNLDKEITFVDGAVEICDENFGNVTTQWVPSYKGQPMRKLIVLSDQCFCGLTWMIRIKSNFQYQFEEGMAHCEDLHFLLKISTTGKYDFIKEPVYLYRKTSNSAMSNSDGLGLGYSIFYKRVAKDFFKWQTSSDRLLLLYKIRKIMFLTFFSEGSYGKAIRYLAFGRT